ncbi:MAG: VIT domain-containing protein [Candidatus Omnitrophota bacterium]
MRKVVLLVGFVSLLFCLSCYAEEEKENLSPYFFVESDDASLDRFPLLETKAEVNIAGVIAAVKLTQVYKNEGKRTIEAVYVFPLGTKSAIHRMKMKIGERVIEANIEKREAAKVIYEQAKNQGKIASLLEQQRPNVFQMKVANIMPNDVVEVIVEYTELITPQDGIYEFVYPTVAGPRYGGELTDPRDSDSWIKNPYLHEGEKAPYNFDIIVNINAGMALNKVEVSSHDVNVNYLSKNEAKITLSPEEKNGGNRDLILRYALEGEKIQSGILLYPGEEENFFLLMAEAPKRVNLEDIPAREYLFIVDVSGSMRGYPLDVSKKLIRDILSSLRSNDYFNILFFAGGSEVLSDQALAASEGNIQKAIAMLQSRRGGGGTNISQALEKALALEKEEGLSRTIVIATDGYVAVEKRTFDIIRDNLGKANVFTFGIGTAVNRYLIEGMARAGRGEPFVVTGQSEASKAARRFKEYISGPVLTDIKVEFEGVGPYDVEPKNIPDLFAQRPIIIYGKYKNPTGTVVISGKAAGEEYRQEISIKRQDESESNLALKYLWARERIAELSDYQKVGEDVREEVTNLGLKYSLMTEYTSFVAVDTVARDTGEAVTVKQPLPLPQGVSDYAVGERARKQIAGNGFNMSVDYSYSGSPVAQGGRVFSRQYVPKDEREVYFSDTGRPNRIKQVYLTGGKFPQGLTIKQANDLLLPLKKQLEKAFNEWSLEEARIILMVEQGKVKDVKIKSYKGRECDKDILRRIFQQINFPDNLTGQVELELICR